LKLINKACFAVASITFAIILIASKIEREKIKRRTTSYRAAKRHTRLLLSKYDDQISQPCLPILGHKKWSLFIVV